MLQTITETIRDMDSENENDQEWLDENVTNFTDIPAYIQRAKARKLVAFHDALWGDFLRSSDQGDQQETFRAKEIFEWLGY